MNTDDVVPGVERKLQRILRRSRFLTIAPIDTGQPVDDFIYASHYEHRLQSQVWPLDGRLVILNNGFLTSHAYNLGLSLLWCHRTHHDPLRYLRHHLKKFFAECILQERNCLAGRALLLETLLYEQGLVIPLFAAAADDPALGVSARTIADAMSSLVSQHELAHIFDKRDRTAFRHEARALFGNRLGPVIDAEERARGWDFALEVQCDAIAAHLFVSQPPDGVTPDTAKCLAAFGFAAFAELYALQHSARATAESGAGDNIDLDSERRPRTAPEFLFARDPALDRRAAIIGELLGEGSSEGFPPLGDTRRALRAANDTLLELEEEDEVGSMTGTSDRCRGLARLVAESLHDHPRGAEFLLWRSKSFIIGGVAHDP